MTDTTTFSIGDRVRITNPNHWTGATGTITGYATTFLGMAVKIDNDPNQPWHFHATDMELIDESTQVDGAEPVAMPSGLAGSPDDDASSTGAEAEPAEASPSPALLYSLLVAQAQAIAQLRGESSFFANRIRELDHQIATSEALDLSESFSRRMRVNITKNTKGYNHDTTFEITSSDPACDLQLEMADGLRLADRLARQAIAEAEYTDAEGVPGAAIDL